MRNLNTVIIRGRFGKKPELKSGKAGSYLFFNLANNRDYMKDEKLVERCNWIPCVAYGKTAETIAKYCTKGTSIMVNGEFEASSYKNDKGEWVNIARVVVHEFEFTGDKSGEAKSADTSPESKTIDYDDAIFDASIF